MSYRLSVETIMDSDAEFGFFYTYRKITKKKANELREQGFVVTDSHWGNNYPRMHKISWEHAEVEYDDVYKLNPEDKSYTPTQRLWIISKQNC